MPIRLASLILRLKFIVNRDIQIATITVVGSATQLSRDALARFHGQHIREVENRLLPVGVFRVRTRAEAHGLVAAGEFNVEPRD
jgi:hypothetical protein